MDAPVLTPEQSANLAQVQEIAEAASRFAESQRQLDPTTAFKIFFEAASKACLPQLNRE